MLNDDGAGEQEVLDVGVEAMPKAVAEEVAKRGFIDAINIRESEKFYLDWKLALHIRIRDLALAEIEKINARKLELEREQFAILRARDKRG